LNDILDNIVRASIDIYLPSSFPTCDVGVVTCRGWILDDSVLGRG
jgi:hypothetical protein